jgi:hypothetical protein
MIKIGVGVLEKLQTLFVTIEPMTSIGSFFLQKINLLQQTRYLARSRLPQLAGPGLRSPVSVTGATDEYQQEQDLLAQFIEEWVQIQDPATVRGS